MSGVLKAVKAGFADLIFVYRHPLDSVLTNWIWWRTWRTFTSSTISDRYKNVDALCGDLDQNFLEFRAFAEGDPEFFAAAPSQQSFPDHYRKDYRFRFWFQGHRFLSFPEFVEETELALQLATLSLRFEDVIIDPLKELSKIAKVMSVDLDLSSVRVDPPIAEPYRYLAVKEKVSRFKDFIDGLDAETKRRIEKIGYKL
jgi:hypothetical protein